MKKILIFMVIIANIVSVCIASANEDSQIKKYHLDQYPGIGELFHWGMNVRDIEKVLNQSLPNIGKDKYQAAFSTGELKMNAVFVVTDKGLEALALQFDIVAEEYSRLLAHLKDIYGDPSGVDAEMGAMQWKDEVNDTGAVIMGEKEGVYSVVVGLRLLRDRVAIKGLEPGKISSLEGVTLGMTKEDFLTQCTHFQVDKLPQEPDMPVNTEVYKAPLTFNLRPAEAFFEFNQDVLTYIMVYVSVKSDTGDLEKAFNNHFGFLSNLYGPPSSETPNMVSWNDGVREFRFGLHPLGEFVISWESLE